VEVAIERASGKIKVERVACAHVGDSPGSKTKIPTEAGGFTGGGDPELLEKFRAIYGLSPLSATARFFSADFSIRWVDNRLNDRFHREPLKAN
jgi:hypothetical protein